MHRLTFSTCSCCDRAGYGPHFLIVSPATGETLHICLDCRHCLLLGEDGRAATDAACPYRRDRHGLHFVGKED